MPQMSIVIARTINGVSEATTDAYEITDRLTETELGQCMHEAVHSLWANGVDPTDMTIVVSFGPRPTSPFRRPA